MKLGNLTKVIKSLPKAAKLFVKKNNAEILLITGSATVITAGVMACKATLKAPQVLEDSKKLVDMCHEAREVADEEEYSKSDYAKDLTGCYVRLVWDLTKLYGPSVTLAILGFMGIFASNHIMRKRCTELAAAYATLDQMFKKYRQNVIERYGEDVDKELRFGVKKVKVEEEIVDENGKTKKIKTTKDVVDESQISDYARFFDETSYAYEHDEYGNPLREYNLRFLKMQERAANERLHREGYLFLNDVYKMLGFEPTAAGNQVGWICNEEAPIEGDGFVSFGIFNTNRANRRFVNGYEDVILLDFNVDGVILNSPYLPLPKI